MLVRQVQDNPTVNPWLLVMVGFAALSVSFSVRAVLGLAMPVIEADVGWSRSYLSGVGALALVLMSFAAPFAGRIIDKSGPRMLMAGGLIAIAIGSGLVSVTSSSMVFAVGFGIIAAAGFAAVAVNVVASAITKTFEQGRGLATGIGTSGATAGQLLVVPIVAVLMQTASWRYGFGALAVIALTLALLTLLLLPRSQRAPHVGSEAPPASASMMAGTGALLRIPAFHILFWSFLICGFTTTGVIETHLLPYASFCGFPPLPSATAYGVLSAINLGGMVLAGFLADRVHRPTLLAAIYLVRAASFMLLLYIAPDIRLLYIFVVLFGLVDYSTVPVTAGLAASHLGVERIGLAMGLLAAGHALGGAFGAMAGGLLFDVTGAFGWLWTGSLGLSVLAGLMVLTLNDKPGPSSRTASGAVARQAAE